MLKLITCFNCSERFSDLSSMDIHILISHTNSRITTPNVLVPKRMASAELINELKKRGKVLSGSEIHWLNMLLKLMFIWLMFLLSQFYETFAILNCYSDATVLKKQ